MGTILGKRFSSGTSPHPSERMKAVIYNHSGPANEVLKYSNTIPRPVPNASSQILIEVYASGLNPVDFKFRSHPLPGIFIPKPKIPGGDVAGRVVSAPSGSGFIPGDRVCALMPLLGSRWGSSAEFAVVDVSLVAKVPENISLIEAASLPLAGLTVLEGFSGVRDKVEGIEDGKAFVQAGSGGVGSIAVQFCKNVLKLSVASTCSKENMELVSSLGCDLCIDYKTEQFDQVLKDYDVVFDVLAYKFESATMHSQVLDKSGHYIHIAASDWDITSRGFDFFGFVIPEARPDRVLRTLCMGMYYSMMSLCGKGPHFHGPVFVHPDGPKLRELMELVGKGKIKPVVDRTFTLEDTAKAHLYLEEGHAKGKVVIVVRDE